MSYICATFLVNKKCTSDVSPTVHLLSTYIIKFQALNKTRMAFSNSRFKSSMTICLPISFHPSSSLLCSCSNSFKILFIIMTTSLIFTTPPLIFLFCIKNNFQSHHFQSHHFQLYPYLLIFAPFVYFPNLSAPIVPKSHIQKYPMNLIVA